MISFREWPAGDTPPPALHPEDAHLWRLGLDVDEDAVPALEASLSADERERADRLVLPAARRRFVVARGALRRILGRYTGRPPGDVAFEYGPWGKPRLDDARGARFSVSHTGDLAVLALHASVELGVDVERVRPVGNRLDLARRFFAPGEHAALEAAPAAVSDLAFLRCWTRKEALSKALGEPLIPTLKRLEVSASPGEPARVVAVDGSASAAAAWTLVDLDPDPEHVGALALRGPVGRVLAWRWP